MRKAMLLLLSFLLVFPGSLFFPAKTSHSHAAVIEGESVQQLTAAEIATGITSIAAPVKGATTLTLPTVPSGFSIKIKNSSREDVIPSMDAQIFPMETDTTVTLILEVTRISDGSRADTAPIQIVVPGLKEESSVDKSLLLNIITSAQSAYDEATEGTEPGQYPKGSKERLLNSIQIARSVMVDNNVKQDGVDASIAVLNLALSEFFASKIIGGADYLDSVTLKTDKNNLNLDGLAHLELSGKMQNGRAADLSHASVKYTVSNTNVIASVTPTDTGADLRAGTKINSAGTAVVTVSVTLDGVTKTDTLTFTVKFEKDRPSFHQYHQTLTMKMFMADNQGKVSMTFEQGLEAIKKMDQLTRGIPKIIYLVGWQFDGHDTGYPALDVVNPKLKRAQDEKAEDSLIWLMDEAFKYNTTVSLHINMLDASDKSPLWQTYLDADVIAREADGSLRKYVWGYPISYTREWEAGLTQKRIDKLLELLPIERAHTIHVDAFHQNIPGLAAGYISPYHEITSQEEAETQKKIIRYFNDKGIDFTSEFDKNYRVDPLIGLQPMAWHIRWNAAEQFSIPASLYVGGDGGDDRLGTGMLGEGTIKADPTTLKGFLEEFSLKTLPWFFLNRLDRISDKAGVVTFSNGVTSEKLGGSLLIKQNGRVLRDGDDVLFPAQWNEDSKKELLAFSKNGYVNRTWTLPDDWVNITAVDIYSIGLDGLKLLEKNKRISEGNISLTLSAGQGISIFPSDSTEFNHPSAFHLLSPMNKGEDVDAPKVTFEWEAAKLADSYRLIVATDSAFQKVVFDETVNTTLKIIPELTNDKQYFWKVIAINEKTKEMTANTGGVYTFYAKKTLPPSAPSGLNAMRISQDTVKLTWKSLDLASSYSVYRKIVTAEGNEDYVLIASNLTDLEYTDRNAQNDGSRNYYYLVTATNTNGEGPRSNPVSSDPVETKSGRIPEVSMTDGQTTIYGGSAVQLSTENNSSKWSVTKPDGTATTDAVINAAGFLYATKEGTYKVSVSNEESILITFSNMTSMPNLTVNNNGNGSAFGSTKGSYPPENVFDGNPATFYEHNSTNAYVGWDFGKPVAINVVRYLPRLGTNAQRSQGAILQGSNVSPSSGFEDLYYISEYPQNGTDKSWYVINLNNEKEYRYYRWLGAVIDGNNTRANVAELQFFVNIDRTALTNEINDAKVLSEADYTSSSWQALKSALTYAVNVNGNGEATQNQIDTAAAILQQAVVDLQDLTIQSLRDIVDGYILSGDLTGPLENQLKDRLDQAEYQLNKGSYQQAAKKMEDFLKHLNNAPMQRYISVEAKNYLAIDAQKLIAKWSSP
ncbi:FIMAH domain-containing protein [Neobacillus sp. NPDC058068]|uniref:FIMAH domain-containing protein n=1 Tax=Neobacillus sp. NPDC058068 TaxID=3346325 RepID=UPI0036DF93F7